MVSVFQFTNPWRLEFRVDDDVGDDDGVDVEPLFDDDAEVHGDVHDVVGDEDVVYGDGDKPTRGTLNQAKTGQGCSTVLFICCALLCTSCAVLCFGVLYCAVLCFVSAVLCLHNGLFCLNMPSLVFALPRVPGLSRWTLCLASLYCDVLCCAVFCFCCAEHVLCFVLTMASPASTYLSCLCSSSGSRLSELHPHLRES